MAASSGRTILVADDNPDQRALYVDILTHAGYEVIQAQDGADVGLAGGQVLAHEGDLSKAHGQAP